jgi:hypothetical protein
MSSVTGLRLGMARAAATKIPDYLPPRVNHPSVVSRIELFVGGALTLVFVRYAHAELPVFARANGDLEAAIVDDAVVAEVINGRHISEVILHEEKILKFVGMGEAEINSRA